MKLKDLVASTTILFTGLAAHTSSGATHTLTVNVSGSGTVSRNPTNSAYPAGATVILTAAPEANWLFAGWSGDASGLLNPLNVLMNSNKIIHAAFVPIPNYTVNLATNGLGSVTLSPPGGTYPSNSTVQVQAIPEAGWVFLNWSGDAGGSANPFTTLMNTNRNIVANFAQPPQITAQPQNVIAGPGDDVPFNVMAVGTEPLSYQWSFNNAPINGATAPSLVVSNVQTTSVGVYRVAVSNVAGSVTSSPASLEIASGCSGSNVITECSEAALRAAIANGGLVKFCCNGTIILSNTIAVSNDIVLDATGFSVAISGDNAVRLFIVNAGANFYLTNLWLINGVYRGTNGVGAGSPGEIAEGGAVLNNGGTIYLISCGLANNRAVGGATVDLANPVSAEGRGGALANRNGMLVLQSVIAMSNSTAGGKYSTAVTNTIIIRGGDAGGGVVFNESGKVVIRDSILQFNAALPDLGGRAKGGAIYMTSGILDIRDSTLASNAAEGGNGVFILMGPGFSSGNGLGGAVLVAGGTANVAHVTILQNEASGGDSFGSAGAAEGGGLYSTGTLAVSDSVFSSNRVVAGTTSAAGGNARAGALFSAGTGSIDRTTFSDNSAFASAGGSARGAVFNGGSGYGGALVNEGVLAVTNSTFALNRAQSGNGGLGALGRGLPGQVFGGAVFSRTGTIHLANVTIASNLVIGGTPFTPALIGGAQIANSNGTVTLFNSIVAYGTNGNGWGTVVDAGYNVSSDGSIPFNSGSSFSFTDPRLGPLKDNGGLTFTMGLLPDSPAIDFGGAAGVPPIDQRGFLRPAGSGFDIGAFEFPGFAPALQICREGETLHLSFEAEAGHAYDLQSSYNLVDWQTLETIGPWAANTSVKRTYSSLNDSREFFRLREE